MGAPPFLVVGHAVLAWLKCVKKKGSRFWPSMTSYRLDYFLLPNPRLP